MSRHFGGAPTQGPDKTKIALFLSFFFLLLFAALAYRLLVRSQGATTQGPSSVVVKEDIPELKMVDVVVPLRKIEEGQKLIPAMFKIEKRPQIGIDNRTVQDIEQVKGFYSRTLLLPGQPVHLDSITKVKPTSAISTKIPPGFRAVTIRVDAESSVEGWARPGSRVDVNWISKIQGKQGVTTIVHNAEVLSANRQSSNNPNNPEAPVPTTVTLLVTAKDAKSIKLGQSTGVLELVLRGDQDTGKVEEGGSITVEDLLSGSRTTSQKRHRVGGTLIMGGKKYLVNEDGDLTPLGDDE